MSVARFILALAIAWNGAVAAPVDSADALAPSLARIKATGVVRLGYRDDALPFSYVGPDGTPVGYSIDLCRAVADTLAEDIGLPALGTAFVRVTAQDRIERVASHAVDLECGSTSITSARRQRVAFSPVIFLTGTRLAVARASRVRGMSDLAGGRVAVVGGTTNEAAVREIDRLRGLKLVIVVVADYSEALALLSSGRADALAADEVLLRGLLLDTGRSDDFRLVGEQFSFEPYGIVYALEDAALADAVERTFAALAASREIAWTYERWFVRSLPSGRSLSIPMSVELRRSWEVLGLPPD